jgi:hypothetical protein
LTFIYTRWDTENCFDLGAATICAPRTLIPNILSTGILGLAAFLTDFFGRPLFLGVDFFFSFIQRLVLGFNTFPGGHFLGDFLGDFLADASYQVY